jgi:succinate dehydrogenase / fumarate reductase membrane anchor subunit|tara:strand:- start:119 stop:442 length:324 start_codon:yes stop_codon:yes gene_type:complete
MISATRKWIFLKVSGALLVPLMIWFILNLTIIYDEEYLKLIDFFTKPFSKFLFSIFIINAYFFSALSISEVFEDYIKNDKIKSVANKLLYVSAVAIPLITIILISSL